MFDAIATEAAGLLESSSRTDCTLLDAANGITLLVPPSEPESGFSEVQMQRFVLLSADALRTLADGAPRELRAEAETVRELASGIERDGADAGYGRGWAESMLDGSSAEQDAALRTLGELLPEYDECEALLDWSLLGGGL